MVVSSTFDKLWPDMNRKERLAALDQINDELKKLALVIEESFAEMFTKIGAPLSIHADLILSIDDNLQDPRLPDT